MGKPRIPVVWSEVPAPYYIIYGLSITLALVIGNWLRPLGPVPAPQSAWFPEGYAVLRAGTSTVDQAAARIEECKLLGDKYAARLGDPGPYINDFNESFISPVSTARDGTFLRLALKAGTDKVTVHSYHYLYSKHLAHARFHDLNVLELGLGCFMRTGTGNSLKLWRAYFPCAKISFLEHIRDCAEKYRAGVERETGGKLYIGEQTDASVMDEIVSDAKTFGGFDLIVDDGSHFPEKQFFALERLWEAVKPGGVYVVEDFYKYFEEAVDLTELPPPNQPLPLFQRLLLTMNCKFSMSRAYDKSVKKWCKEHQDEFQFSDVVNVDCMAETCAIVKGQAIAGW